MDVLAHGLWTNIMYRWIPATKNNRRLVVWGIFFGVLPDLVSFAPFFADWFWQFVSGQAAGGFGKPEFISSPWLVYAEQSYNYSHSLVIFALVFVIVRLYKRGVPWVLLGWGLHITMDIFSHTREFFATPFLFPVSRFEVSGVSWAHPVFMLINYALLLIIYIFVLPKFRKQKTPPEGRDLSLG